MSAAGQHGARSIRPNEEPFTNNGVGGQHVVKIFCPAAGILTTMTSSTDNIEAVARDICSRQLARHGAHWCQRHPESKPTVGPA